MPIENCTSCGKVFNRTHRDICPPCWESEQDLVDKIADFLNVHPKAEPGELLDRLGIAGPAIARLLRRGRLVGYDQLTAFLRCERCGSQVDRGNLCAAGRAVVLELAGTPKEDEEDPEANPVRPGKPLGKPGAPNPDKTSTRPDFRPNRAR